MTRRRATKTDLLAEVEALRRSLARAEQALGEALEQQTATAEILRAISSFPTDIRPVLDAVADCAARLCDSLDGSVFQVDGNMVRLVAHKGPIPERGKDISQDTLLRPFPIRVPNFSVPITPQA